MKKIDLLIINELKKDPLIPFSRIAEKLEVSPETIRKRYIKMRKEGQIRGCLISIDLSKLGYQSMAWLWIKNTKNSSRAETIDSLKKLQNIIGTTEITGEEFNILVTAALRDLKDLHTLVNVISSLSTVNRVEFCLSDKLFFPSPE
jgi:DNA-binding Lrp family transcriptional regulator